MQISQRGLDIIKKWEGFYSRAYDDGEGVWTIGYGTIKWDMKTPVRKGDTITRDEAEFQLKRELHRVEDAIDASVKVPLTQPEFDALCSLLYNIGTGWCTGIGHQQATLFKRLNKGDYNVANEFLKFTRGANSGTVYEGLRNRRKDEVRLWLTPESEAALVIPAADPPHDAEAPPATPMPQTVRPAPGSAVRAAKESLTIRSVAAGIIAGILQLWNALFSTVKEAGAQVADIRTATGPFDALLTAMKANMMIIAAVIVIIAFLIAGLRRLQAAREGKTG